MKTTVFWIMLLLACAVWGYSMVKFDRKDKTNLVGTIGTPAPQLPDEVMAWAFGDQWRLVKTPELPDMWNEKHSDLFLIHGFDDILKTNAKIQKAWKEKDGE